MSIESDDDARRRWGDQRLWHLERGSFRWFRNLCKWAAKLARIDPERVECLSDTPGVVAVIVEGKANGQELATMSEVIEPELPCGMSVEIRDGKGRTRTCPCNNSTR